MQVSIRVGDGMPDVPIDDLISDLTHAVHDAAAVHYGRRRWSRGCQSLAFSPETDGREAFELALRKLGDGEETVALHLAEWDGSIRPVAVIHYWTEPVH